MAHPMAEFRGRRYEGWSMSSSGYAGVWATDNTREALFDAMMRKEVYATTGPRILVRFWGGWDVWCCVLRFYRGVAWLRLWYSIRHPA